MTTMCNLQISGKACAATIYSHFQGKVYLMQLSLTLAFSSFSRFLYSEDVGFLRLSENFLSEPSLNLTSINLSGNTNREMKKKYVNLNIRRLNTD